MVHNLIAGQLVQLTEDRTGIIRFIGQTTFATGEWIGVELDDPIGKNNGSVKGVKYFQCRPGHGMFLRSSAIIRVLEEPTPRADPPTAVRHEDTIGGRGRAGSRSIQLGRLDVSASRRRDLNDASPTPGGRRLPSFQSNPSPTKSNASLSSTFSTTSDRNLYHHATNQFALARSSQGSVASEDVPPVPRMAPSEGRLDNLDGQDTSRTQSQEQSEAGVDPENLEDTTTRSEVVSQAPASRKRIEELEVKLRLLEQKRAEDREKLKSLERLQGERDRFEGIIKKLQTKYQPQQQQLAALRKQLLETEAKLLEAGTNDHEDDTALEVATLDREMAEETADQLRSEVGVLEARIEDLEEEIKVLREENEELGHEMSTEERTSQGWLQLERSNERMKEALLRLREMSQSQEAQLKGEITSLQGDLKQFNGIKEQHDIMIEKLRQSGIAVEELRQQLDDALGAEELVEELTEKNLSLTDEVDHLRFTLTDLDKLRELNDELETGHIEAERQLQEELDYRDAMLAEQNRRAARQGEKLTEQDHTISQFRGLVVGLQTHLNDMKAAKQLTEAEADELTDRSRAMEDLNLKLQHSAAKAQVKSVDVELARLEAQEAEDHLNIVQEFLPDEYKSEKDSVLAFLRLKRVAFKARLLYTLLKDQISAELPTISGEECCLFCVMLDGLMQISITCLHLVDHIRSSSLEIFRNYGVAIYEVEPVERGLDNYIGRWKLDELKMNDASEDVHRFVALLTHLKEVHMVEVQHDMPTFISNTMLIQSNLENAGISMDFVQAMTGRSNNGNVEVNEVSQDPVSITKQLAAMTIQIRGSQAVAGKALRNLQELAARGMTMNSDTLDMFLTASKLTSEAAVAARELVVRLDASLHEQEQQHAEDFAAAMSLLNFNLPALPPTNPPNALTSLTTHLRLTTTTITTLHNLTTTPSQTTEISPSNPPWTLQATTLRATHRATTATTNELTILRTTLQTHLTTLHARDQKLEEQSLKIELLESRMHDAIAKASRIAELEQTLEGMKATEAELQAALKRQMGEAKALVEERDRLRAAVDAVGAIGEGASEGAVASAREVGALRSEIRDLQGAVRLLRREGHKARYGEAEMAWLREPLVRRRPASLKGAAKKLEDEGVAALAGLLEVVAGARVVSVVKVCDAGRLAWRPMREKSAWVVAGQREVWEGWRAEGERWMGRVEKGGVV